MRIHPFAKDAGLRLFAPAFTERVSQQARQAPHDAALQTEAGAAERLAAVTIEAYVRAQDLDVCGLRVLFDGARCTVHVQGVAQVHDLMTVVAHAGCSRFHRVSNGDSLPQIAEHCYGDAACWPRILDANRPMLHAPDHIYSGQVLRIPA